MDIATDRKDKSTISLATHASRVIFICGKRGTGKSYTLGHIAEEIVGEGMALAVLVDSLAVFWSTAIPTDSGPPIPVRVLVPGDPVGVLGADLHAAMSRYVDIQRLWLNPADISPDAWLALFDYGMDEPQGMCLYRGVLAVQERSSTWALADLVEAVRADEDSGDRTIAAVLNRLSIAQAWGIFAKEYTDTLSALAPPGTLNVVDVAAFDPGPQSLRNLVARLLVQRLFAARFASCRRETLGMEATFPRVWLLIDEAHDFCPAQGDALAKRALIRWVKEGRQPGLSLAVAVQQPSALDFDLISQCNVYIIHHLTLHDDVKTVARLSSSYAEALPAYLKGVRGAGEAIIVDDAVERVTVGKVLPRRGKHGGGEAIVESKR